MSVQPPPAVSFVGKKNSGKTSVVVQVVSELKAMGLRVGTLKHAHSHDFEMDKPGRDSHRHYEAGAEVVVISSSVKLATIRRTEREPLAREIIAEHYDGVDVVLVEGYKTQDLPRIEIFRPSVHRRPLPDDGHRIALVTDGTLDLGVPRFGFDQMRELAHFVADRCCPQRPGR